MITIHGAFILGNWVCDLGSHTGPHAQKDPHLIYYSPDAFSKFLITFEQVALILIFHGTSQIQPVLGDMKVREKVNENSPLYFYKVTCVKQRKRGEAANIN